MKTTKSIFTSLIVSAIFTLLISCSGGGGSDSGGTPPPAPKDPILTTYYRDYDGDGYGDPNVYTEAETKPKGYVSGSNDCNDEDPGIHPNAIEVCDNVDNDCDGEINEGFNDSCERITFYLDDDNDGFGDPEIYTEDYIKPDGFVLNNDDCNDEDPEIHPNAIEVCDYVDNDCDGEIDEGFNDSCERITFYRDYDGDGYGDIGVSIEEYQQPSGYVPDSRDCNDADPEIHPGATEICNGIDDNCNKDIDEGFNDSCQGNVVLLATEDTYAEEADSETNFGKKKYLRGMESGGYERRIFIKFDLSSIPSNARIIKATLEMRTIWYMTTIEGQTSIFQIRGRDWNENTLTWKNSPKWTSGRIDKHEENYDNKTIYIDVKAFVDLWVGGEIPNYGFKVETRIYPVGDITHLQFYSKEFDPRLGPTLTIIYE